MKREPAFLCLQIDARNLAIIFGPTLIWDSKASLQSNLVDNPEKIRVIESLILYVRWNVIYSHPALLIWNIFFWTFLLVRMVFRPDSLREYSCRDKSSNAQVNTGDQLHYDGERNFYTCQWTETIRNHRANYSCSQTTLVIAVASRFDFVT